MINFFKTLDTDDIKMIARVAVFAIAWINQLLVQLGYQAINVDNDTIYNILTQLFTLISSVYLLWRNNDFTKTARERRKNGD